MKITTARVLAALCLASVPAAAGSFAVTSTEISLILQSPSTAELISGIGLTGTSELTRSGAFPIAEYNVAATGRMTGVTGSTATAPLTFSLTDLTLSCITATQATCTEVLSRFGAFVYFENNTLPSIPVSIDLAGNLSQSPLSLFVGTEVEVFNQLDEFVDRQKFESAYDLTSIDFSHNLLSGPVDLPAAGRLAVIVSFRSTLAANQTLNLPDSLTLTIGQTPSSVPEPGALVLFGSGALALAWLRRRRS